jgi:membrane associated rhomboid family serine protease
MFFPYRDENQTQRRSVVTILIILANVAVWLLVQGAGAARPLARSVCELGLIPGELTGLVQPGTEFPVGRGLSCLTEQGHHLSHVITSMFLHGSWLHLIGNMWFLWLFGDNVEDSMTRPRFVVFYLACGLAAAAAQVVSQPGSALPMVGASGAISGVMGAYLVLYPRVRVFVLVFLGFFITTLAVPAWAMLLYWIGIQVVSGLAAAGDHAGGVAFWAHVGGFAAGVLLVRIFGRRDRIAAHGAGRWRPQRLGWR